MTPILLQSGFEPMSPAFIHFMTHYDWLVGILILGIFSAIAYLVYRVSLWTIKEIKYSLYTK